MTALRPRRSIGTCEVGRRRCSVLGGVCLVVTSALVYITHRRWTGWAQPLEARATSLDVLVLSQVRLAPCTCPGARMARR